MKIKETDLNQNPRQNPRQHQLTDKQYKGTLFGDDLKSGRINFRKLRIKRKG